MDPSQAVAQDPLRRMRAYQLGSELLGRAWMDAEALRRHATTASIGPQLYSAVASINANLGEGYSRSSGRDRARLFEYALGSARESIEWYSAAIPVLGEQLVAARQAVLTEIRRLLLATIPRERDRQLRPGR